MARILIIDDEEHIRITVSKLLAIDGHDTLTAKDGVMGLKMLEREIFDLVITDMVMPEGDGLEVIRAVQNMESPPVLIAMSGGSRHLEPSYLLDLAQAMKASFVLPKPITYDSLHAVVVRALENRMTSATVD